jgi:hypothetical protein
MSTMNPLQSTIVHGRCSACKTAWQLNVPSHTVTYRPPRGRPITISTAEEGTGDDSWRCPVIVEVNLDYEDDDGGLVTCGTEESHDSDEDWRTDR